MIPNLLQIENSPFRVLRGGQPECDEDWQALKLWGVNQAIKLNEDYEGKDTPDPALGITVFKCPISLIQQTLTEPDLQVVRSAVSFIREGTFIHCTHGQDRTGLVVALWRVSQGWTTQFAHQEMFNLGFHWELFGLSKAWFDLSNEIAKKGSD